MPSDRGTHARAWLAKAGHDLLAAEELLRLGADAPLEIVCFHAQQCVEKCLKALLVARSIDFPRTHDLVLLARRVAELRDQAPSIEELLHLNRYAVEARYPGDWEAISMDEARQAVDLAGRINRDAARWLGSAGD